MKSYDYKYGIRDLFSRKFLKVITGRSLERALDEAHGDCEDQRRWDAWSIFWKKGWFGKAAKNSISAAADNKKARKRALRTFWGLKNPISFVAIMLAMIFIIPIIAPIAKSLVTGGVNQILSMSGRPANFNALKATIEQFGTANYTKEMVVFDDFVDIGLDNSTSGQRSFVSKGFKSKEEAVTFIKSDSLEAQGERYLITFFTDCNLEEMYDINNYVFGQFLVKSEYQEMTYWTHDGKIHNGGTRTANKGDTFVAFVAPRSKKMVILRSACGNPSLFIPKPLEIIKPTTTEGTTILETTTGETTIPETTVVTTGTTEGTTEGTTGTTEGTTATTTPATTTTTAPTTTTTTKPSTTSTTYLESKDPSDDVLANLAKIVDQLWKTNGDEKLTVSDDPNASNGIQVDPVAAAAAAKKAADEAIKAANEALAKAIEEAKNNGAGVVDTGETHVAIEKPTDAQGHTDPNWSPFS